MADQDSGDRREQVLAFQQTLAERCPGILDLVVGPGHTEESLLLTARVVGGVSLDQS